MVYFPIIIIVHYDYNIFGFQHSLYIPLNIKRWWTKLEQRCTTPTHALWNAEGTMHLAACAQITFSFSTFTEKSGITWELKSSDINAWVGEWMSGIFHHQEWLTTVSF